MAKGTKKKKKPKKKSSKAGGRSLSRAKAATATIAVRSEQQLHKYLTSGKPVLIDFWADWCGPCKAMAPSFEAAAEQWKDRVHFLKVDTERAPGLSESFGIRSLPTLLAMVGDEVIDTKIGATDAETLGKMAQRALDKAEGVGLGGKLKRMFT